MKADEFIKALPDLEQAKADGDKWAIVFFSKVDDGYRVSVELDSGDALIVIEELINRCGVSPKVLASMHEPDKDFDMTVNGFRAILPSLKKK
jgi:hypothetical protein